MPHGQHPGFHRGSLAESSGNAAYYPSAYSVGDSRRPSTTPALDIYGGTGQSGSQTDRAPRRSPSPPSIPGHNLHILSNGQHFYTPRYHRHVHPGSPAWNAQHEQLAARAIQREALRRQQDREFHARLLDSSVARFKHNRKIIKAAVVIQRHFRKWLARRQRRLVGGLAVHKANSAAAKSSARGGAKRSPPAHPRKLADRSPRRDPGYRSHSLQPTHVLYPSQTSRQPGRSLGASDEEPDFPPRLTPRQFERGTSCHSNCVEQRMKALGLGNDRSDVAAATAGAVAVVAAHRRNMSGGRDPASMAAHHHQRAREAAHDAALATDRKERVRAWRRAHLEELAALQHMPQQVPVFHLSPELARKSARMRAIQERP
eukprot:jgi/Mesvir1/21962/Mv08201-RA.1